MVSRADRSRLSQWWWTIDKSLLISAIVMMAGGLVLSLAASPAIAERLNVDSMHFFKRHVLFLVPALLLMTGISFLDKHNARRAAIALFLISMALMVLTMFFGFEAKGSRRWLSLGSFSLQPSEFLKPGFVVVAAWLFAENARRPDIPGNLFSIILYAIVIALLVAQPDLGQSILITGVWAAMFFIAGMPWIWILGMGAFAIIGLATAYIMLDHFSSRIDRFLTGSGDTFQVDTGLEAIVRGGWFGQGPGEGTVKRILPDSHTDFVFAVAGEEFGILICILLIITFAFIVLRGFTHAFRERDGFVRLSVAGLMMLFGFQSIINMAVNLQLMPAKGMTLPFISYGGSSLIAVAIGMGLTLALTKTRPDSRRYSPGIYTPNTMQAAE
jgi:cell division protein FtsW